jgi:hypothetical protein
MSEYEPSSFETCLNSIGDIPAIAWNHGGRSLLLPDNNSREVAQIVLENGFDSIVVDSILSSPSSYAPITREYSHYELIDPLNKNTILVGGDFVPRNTSAYAKAYVEDYRDFLLRVGIGVAGLSAASGVGGLLAYDRLKQNQNRNQEPLLTRRKFLQVGAALAAASAFTAGGALYIESRLIAHRNRLADDLNTQNCDGGVPIETNSNQGLLDLDEELVLRNAVLAYKAGQAKRIQFLNRLPDIAKRPALILGSGHLEDRELIEASTNLANNPASLNSRLGRLISHEQKTLNSLGQDDEATAVEIGKLVYSIKNVSFLRAAKDGHIIHLKDAATGVSVIQSYEVPGLLPGWKWIDERKRYERST